MCNKLIKKILKSATPFLPPAIVPEGNRAKSQLDSSKSKLYELLALCQESWKMCLYLLLCLKRCCQSLTDKELLTYRRWRMRVSLPPHMCLSSATWMGGSKDQARGEPNRTPCTLRLAWKGQGENIKKILIFLFSDHIYVCSPSMWNSHTNIQIFSIIFLHNWPLVNFTVCPKKSSR